MVVVLRKAYGGLVHRRKLHDTKKIVMVEGESASIPWTHISHEELTYLLRKFLLVIETKC